MGLTPPPLLVCRGPRKSRAILLLTSRAFVAYKKGWKPTYVFEIQLDHFVPMEGVVLVQQLRKEKQFGNAANSQNGCARTTLS